MNNDLNVKSFAFGFFILLLQNPYHQAYFSLNNSIQFYKTKKGPLLTNVLAVL